MWDAGFHPEQSLLSTEKGPCEEVLRDEIEKLAARYPTYGYRRITQLLVNHGYTVGYRRVARLMKSENLSVAVKRARQTTHSEEVHLNDCKDVMEARDRIGHFITQVYHQKRLHSALGYLTPIEFQRKPNLS